MISSGKRCEYLVTVQLVSEGSFISLDPLYTVTSLNISLVIKTKEQYGVLLYTGDRQHLAVELFKVFKRLIEDTGIYWLNLRVDCE